MNPSDDKQLFLDMQEHPENYSDKQLEQMMAELDKEPNAEEAWQKVAPFHLPRGGETNIEKASHSGEVWRGAAAFLAAAFLGVLSFAGYRAFSDWHGTARSHVETDTSMVKTERFVYDVQNGDTIFRFENIRLDSILAVVARHYNRQVVFRDKAPRHLRLYMTCHTTRSLTEFVEMLNMFDGFRVSKEFDTLFVEADERKEGMR